MGTKNTNLLIYGSLLQQNNKYCGFPISCSTTYYETWLGEINTELLLQLDLPEEKPLL